MTKDQGPLEGKALVDQIIARAREKKAGGIVVLDIRKAASMADWLVVCQGENPMHTRAVFEAILTGLKQIGTRPLHYEGDDEGRWILIDYVDVLVHIMLPHLRRYYALEDLWHEAERTDIPDES